MTYTEDMGQCLVCGLFFNVAVPSSQYTCPDCYRRKINDRKEHFLQLAEKKKREADQKYQASKQIADQIPFGQPILVGHHSEKRHRKLISSIHSNMRASIELDKKAEYYAKKAETYGDNGIKSDDPEVLKKLHEKLYKAKEEHEMLKKQRKLGNAEAYQLANSNSRIRSIQKRIDTIKKTSETTIAVQGDGWRIYEYDQRICFASDAKPEQDMISLLKRFGFKWSPTRKAWVRIKTPNAIYSTKRLIKEI